MKLTLRKKIAPLMRDHVIVDARGLDYSLYLLLLPVKFSDATGEMLQN